MLHVRVCCMTTEYRFYKKKRKLRPTEALRVIQNRYEISQGVAMELLIDQKYWYETNRAKLGWLGRVYH